jgi:hypothetical protein
MNENLTLVVVAFTVVFVVECLNEIIDVMRWESHTDGIVRCFIGNSDVSV